ncbi:MAG: hypothetical protein KDK55_00345 [Chlamydiia bacterium]|nr:hypothetical protein [Chlamydiia bacterium]
MKKCIFILALIALFPLFGNEPSLTIHDQDEIVVLKQLIEATQKSLNEQHTLLQSILRYRAVRELFFDDTTNSRKATNLVKMALQISNQLEESKMTHLFSKEFLEELSFYSSVGRKNGLGK